MDGALRSGGPPSPAIRPAGPDDIDALLAIEDAAFPTDRLDRRGFRHAIRSPTIDALVAAEAGPPIGYAMVHRRRDSRVGRLTSIAVLQTAAGRGLGRVLLAAAEHAARRQGCERLRLEVRSDNTAAQSLYERSGYARFATVPGYYEDGKAAYRYEKRLA